MNKNKLLLTSHTLTLLPLLIFLLIYPQFSTLSFLSALAVAFSLLFNIYRYTKKLTLINYPLLLILVSSFLLYGYFNLGSTKAPQSYEVMHHKAYPTATFDFKKKQKIDKLCYNIGINKKVNFHFENLDNNSYKKFYEYENKFPYSFRWECQDINISSSQVRLSTTKNQMMLNEVHFLSAGKSLNYTTDKPKLNDEQNISIDTTYYGGTFFDEIYHSRTAYEIIRGIKVYETTHPYLGKILIIPGIELFGMTPFGWRFTNVLFASLLIVVAYYFSLALFRKPLYALSGAFLMTYSFMHLTQSRIGLIDTFGVLLVFISFYYLYKFIKKQTLTPLLISGVFFGLAAAVKWSAVFAALGFIFIALYLLITRYSLKKEFAGYKLILYGLLSYGLIAVFIYTLTFYDIYLQTGSLAKIFDYQVNMLNYHAHVISEHPYGSPWWSWPFDYKPMCYYRLKGELAYRSINAFGNPAIFWIGSLTLLYLLYKQFKKTTLESAFILLAFLGLYLPYVFIGRQMFIYHFYYAVPFMILAIVYTIKNILEVRPKYEKYAFVYLGIVAILFLVFYPVLSGYAIPQEYAYALRWLPKWWL